MADKRISQLIERTDIANNDVLPIVASGATTTNKVTISTIQTWMQDNLDVGVTSVGLSMPSAFVVSNSPVTASGNITVTGAGTVAQYIRGDGSLADFPQSAGGGGASVSYYLNGSVSQGTIGGIAYLEMNKTPILGAGTDFTINADGYIASFITDAGDPGLLEIPAGNWNFETYLSATSGGGSPTFYIQLYKVNSGGTATLIASNSATPESISLGTNINPYFSALAVPQTTLALTDRLALRYYVTHAGRTITLHTENSHLCQIITTFTTGLTALNGLTAQVQNFATGTSGTDFNISSAGSTHTFNIPSASATARGLVTTGSQTIQGTKTFITTGYTTFTNNDFFQAEFSNGSSKLNLGSASNIGYISSNGELRFVTNYPTDSLINPKLTISTNGQATFSNDAVINGVNVGRGASSVATNTRLGFQTLVFNTTGSSNTSVGWSSLYLNTTGSANSSFGTLSLENNTTGTGNTAIGYVALRNNTTGGSNTATGYLALNANTTGNANTATGAYALENNTTGSNNTAVGQEALENNIVGTFNTAIGFQALRENTNSSNTAIGYLASSKNTSGSSNFSGGARALENTTTGSVNTSIGFASLQTNTTGGGNVAIGEDAGRFTSVTSVGNTNGNDSVFIGRQSKPLGDSQTNQIVIGHLAVGNGSNTVTLGNDSITTTFLKGNISLKGENSAVKSIQYTNPSGTLHWSVQTSFGSAGEHQPFSIRNGVLGTDAILIQPASNNITLNNSITNLLGSLSGTTATFSGTVRPTTNMIADLGSGSIRWSTLFGRNIDLTEGAIIGGALTGTSATFAGRARFQGTGYDTLGSAEIMLTNTTASTGRSFIVNSSNAGEFLISDVSAGQTRLSINSSGAVTLTGALSGTSASFNTTNAITLTASDSRIRGGDTTGRLLLANSGTSTYGIFYGSSHATLPNAIQFVNDNTTSLTLSSTGAATFSSSVSSVGLSVTGSNGAIAGTGLAYINNSDDAFALVLNNNGLTNQNDRGVFEVRRQSNSIFRVNNSGNVGIGTASPVRTLNLYHSSTPVFAMHNSTTTVDANRGFLIYVDGNDSYIQNKETNGILGFITGGNTERMRITSGGNVGIGTASPNIYNLTNTRNLTLVNDAGYGIIAAAGSSGNGGEIDLGTSSIRHAAIASLDGSNLGFYTNGSNSGTGVTERMRITSGGNTNILGNLELTSGTNRSIILGSATNYNYRLRTDGDDFAINEAGAVDRLRYSYLNARWTITGGLTVSGSLSKGSGSFKIDHPLPEKKDTHHLVHSFVEAPQADNIYRGKIELVDGYAEVNIDEASGMSEGTFVLLNGNIQCFTSNEEGWTAIRGKVDGNILKIEAQDSKCTDTISWLVIGERIDQHMIDTDWTDENGKVIVEPLKEVKVEKEEAEIEALKSQING